MDGEKLVAALKEVLEEAAQWMESNNICISLKIEKVELDFQSINEQSTPVEKEQNDG